MSEFRTLFNQKGGSQRAAVEANRDHDVQLDAALGELIDNSIEHSGHNNFDGNTILLEISNKKYCFIGHSIYEFSTKDKITKYESPVGNNDVPYPLAYGEENLYFLMEGNYLSKDLFSDMNVDNLWEKYSGEFTNKGWNGLSKKSKKIKSKLIHKRI